MNEQRNIAVWFEIPVINMERAIQFYEKVFNMKLQRHQMGPLDMAWFPMVDNAGGSMGSLVCNKEYYKPSSTDGVLIYLASQGGDVGVELARIEKAGGKISIPKTLIAPDIGYMAVFIDSEGNRVALHSRG